MDNIIPVNFKNEPKLFHSDGTEFSIHICDCGGYEFWVALNGLMICSSCKNEYKTTHIHPVKEQ